MGTLYRGKEEWRCLEHRDILPGIPWVELRDGRTVPLATGTSLEDVMAELADTWDSLTDAED